MVRSLKRIFLVIGLILAGLILFLAGSVVVEEIAGRNRIGVLGFCYGGRASLAYSLHNNRLAATVIFYGSLETDPQVLQALSAPVLGIFGGADNSIPLDQVRAFEIALEQAGIPFEITIYDGQPHAFVTDVEAIRAGGVQVQAWAQMLKFLEQNLKVKDARLRPGSGVTYTAPIDFAYSFVLAYEHSFGRMNHSH